MAKLTRSEFDIRYSYPTKAQQDRAYYEYLNYYPSDSLWDSFVSAFRGILTYSAPPEVSISNAPPPIQPPGAPQTLEQMVVPGLWTQQDAINASMASSKKQWDDFFVQVAQANEIAVPGVIGGIPNWLIWSGIGLVGFLILTGRRK